MADAGRIRVGAVAYLNTKPLISNFASLAPAAELVLDLPSRLADRLAAEELDVALIPSIEFFQNPAYRIVSDAAIACRGPVWSVKVFFRKPPAEVKTLALDEGSRTSAALARILLQQRFGVAPQLLPLPLGNSLQDTSADAVLLIGDRAMNSQPGPFAEVWDLGDEWRRWSGLPFVFAMWVARPGLDLHGLEPALAAARDDGLANLERIAAAEAPRLGLTRPECIAYLRDNLYFFLGEEELAGLNLYYRLASELGLAPRGVEFGFYDCSASG